LIIYPHLPDNGSMPSTLIRTLARRTTAPVVSTAMENYATHNHNLRLFAVHVAHVVATRIEKLTYDKHDEMQAPWLQYPLIHLLHDEAFLTGTGAIYRMARTALGNEDVTHEMTDVANLVLDAAAEHWVGDGTTYSFLIDWTQTWINWSDQEKINFLSELFPHFKVS
jgi:hypothetical protein